MFFTKNDCNKTSIWPCLKRKGKKKKTKLCLLRGLPGWRSKWVHVCVNVRTCKHMYTISACLYAWMDKGDCCILYNVNAFIHTTIYEEVCKCVFFLCVCVWFFFPRFYHWHSRQFFSIFHVWDVNHCKLKHRASGSCRVGTDTIYSQSLVYKGHFHSYILLLLLPDRWMLTQQCFSVQLLYMHEMRALSVYRSNSLLQPI